jgi:hypothetical protein
MILTPNWTSRKNSLELTELSSSFILAGFAQLTNDHIHLGELRLRNLHVFKSNWYDRSWQDSLDSLGVRTA